MKLNLGCGRDIRAGWINIDSHDGRGVDLVVDLDRKPWLPWPDDSVDEIHGSHVLEHLHYPLPLMAELWRVAKPGARAVFRVPYGSSDSADEDPTHVRRLFLYSWGYFSQPYYWRASYSYEADWKPTRVVLRLEQWLAEASDDEVAAALKIYRNTVREMTATLIAVKPIRPAVRDAQEPFEVVYDREWLKEAG